MPFNASKCKVMQCTLVMVIANLVISWVTTKLESVNEEKDLGIFITDNLKPTIKTVPTGIL